METKDTKIKENTRAILCSVITDKFPEAEATVSLLELSRLLETAGGEAFAIITQKKENPDVRTCFGKGKVEELKEACENNDITLVIFDCELTPSQIRNLEKELGDVDVIDRTMLILDIFALHAKTNEGKLQVELAQLKYTAPRLIGKGAMLSRQEGRIGTRGPGESKLESDRRHLQRRIYSLQEQLSEMERTRATMRKSRDDSKTPSFAIVGYTNAGKSTLLNALTDAGILAEDKLFATLDPTTRRFSLPSGREILLTDTVGFIRRLPHQLVNAFRSTLEEAALSDHIIIVLDASDPEMPEQLRVTEELLSKLGAGNKPTVYVFNKADACDFSPERIKAIKESGQYNVFVSAKNKEGLDIFLEMLEDIISKNRPALKFFFPHSKQAELSRLHKISAVKSVEYLDDGTLCEVLCDDRILGIFREFLVEE